MLEIPERVAVMCDGIRYGSLGKIGIDRFIGVLSDADPKFNKGYRKSLDEAFESIPANVIAEYFCKNDVARMLFGNAIELEALAFSKEFVHPNLATIHVRSIISVLLDFNSIDRRKFFDLFPKVEQPPTLFGEIESDEVKTS